MVGDNVGEGADENGRVIERRGSRQMDTELSVIGQHTLLTRPKLNDSLFQPLP